MPFKHKFNPFTKKPDYYEEAPPPAIEKGWELVKTGTFTNDIDITGLDGDVDKLWMLVIKARHTDVIWPRVRFNSDATGSYRVHQHYHGVHAGTDYHTADNPGVEDSIPCSYYARSNVGGEYIIYAQTEGIRLVQVNGSVGTDENNFESYDAVGFWLNTTANITTINIVIGAAIIAGEYWLFKQKS